MKSFHSLDVTTYFRCLQKYTIDLPEAEDVFDGGLASMSPKPLFLITVRLLLIFEL
jgi:hypothetical protein